MNNCKDGNIKTKKNIETLKREMDGVMLEFPLCSLSYQTNDRERVDLIISYCLMEYSKKIKIDVCEAIDFLTENLPNDFDQQSSKHIRLLVAAQQLGIILESCSRLEKDYKKLLKHISNYAIKYGSDAYCRVGKRLCFEARDGILPYRQFAIICAVQSIIGKTAKYKKITKDRIRYAMRGYKSKNIALLEKEKDQIRLTDRQIGKTLEILQSKRLFTKFTFANRQPYYSTLLNNVDNVEQAIQILGEWIEEKKIYWAKRNKGTLEKEISKRINENLRLIKIQNNRTEKYGNA